MSRYRRYGTAFLLVLASLLFRLVLQPWLGLKVPYLQFFPAIMLAAWFGGFGPGVAATILSSAAAAFFFVAPAGSLAVPETSDLISIGLFVATGLGIVWFNHRLRDTESALHEAAAEARAHAQELDTILNTVVDGIIVIDPHGRIEVFNPAAERMFGYTEGEIVGQNVTRLMPSPYREEHDTYLTRYLATGVKKIIGLGREVRGLRRDGTTFPLQLSVGEMIVNGERKFTGILHDLSTRTEMERQLREQAALAHLGEMAAVVAHEVKNPLAGIRGAIQVIGGRLAPASKDALIVKEIVTRIDALADLMRQLLLFARPPSPKPAPVDLAGLIGATSALLSEDPALREVQVHVEGSAPPTMADASLLQVVFHNLLINSAQAMQGRGRIRVSIESVDSICHIAFIDAGPGMPADVREKIFTPFFTTKVRGSGLGLPTSKRLIEAHQGSITVECPPAGGTTVLVQLPLVSAMARSAGAP